MDNDDKRLTSEEMELIKEEVSEILDLIRKKFKNMEIKSVTENKPKFEHFFYKQMVYDMVRGMFLNYLSWQKDEDKSEIYTVLTMNSLLIDIWTDIFNDKDFKNFIEVYSKAETV